MRQFGLASTYSLRALQVFLPTGGYGSSVSTVECVNFFIQEYDFFEVFKEILVSTPVVLTDRNDVGCMDNLPQFTQ